MASRAKEHPRDPASWLLRVPDDEPRASDLIEQAAHDLRQPVAAILALTSAALAEAQLPESARLRIGQIADQASWMSGIIRDMVAGDGDVMWPEAVEVGALVRDAVASERLTYPGMIVLCQAQGEPRYVSATRQRLRRGLANVLTNATRAAGRDGRVELTERPHGDMEIVEIVDDGPGFGKVEHGLGMGLRITRRMLAECGGRMEHERLGSGHTRVRLILPVMPAGRLAGAR
jgi:signal transduction histidine kinase